METNLSIDTLLNDALPRPVFCERDNFLSVESFSKNGFMVVPNVLSEEEINRIKLIFDNYLSDKNATESEIPSSRFLNFLDLSSVPFNDKVIKISQELLGKSYTVYSNFVARLNRFTKWHVDNGFHSKYLSGNSNFLYEPEFKHAQCIIYLQDNTEETGGGLDVVPETHLKHIPMDNPEKNDISLLSLIKLTQKAISLKTYAGDLILFDGRLLHRGTQPKGETAKKYGIFWGAAKSESTQVQSYLSYLSKRSDFLNNKGQSKNFMIERYSDLHSIKYPDSFLPEIVEKIRINDLNIATLENLNN